MTFFTTPVWANPEETVFIELPLIVSYKHL